jgi:hypothetical protein
VTVGRTSRFLGAVVTAGQRGPCGNDGRADGVVPWRGGDGGGGSQGGGGVAPMVEDERDNTAVKVGQTTRFPGVAIAWRWSGWWRRGLGDVKEGVENFGSLTASKSKSSS